MAWVEADVHAWTARMCGVLQSEMPELVAQSVEAEARYPAQAKQMHAYYSHKQPILDKIASRGGMRDRDLCGASPLGLLVIAWETVDRDALGMMLADIGHTCLQGDTFRLFSLILADRRSKITAAADEAAAASASATAIASAEEAQCVPCEKAEDPK